MKLTAGKAAAFIEKPDKALCLFLLYGPDHGLVKERSLLLARQFVADIKDPFSVSDLAGDGLKDDPARLMDEMSSVPMLGGRRLVRILGASDAAFAAVDALLNNPPPGDAVCLVEAGELEKRSRLRARVEDDARAMAIPCYAEEGAALARAIGAMIRAEGFTIEPDALQAFAAKAPSDRIAIRMEVEKLATYALKSAPKRMTLEDVTACLSAPESEDADEAIWAAFSGDDRALAQSLARLPQESGLPIQIMRGSQRHLMRLYEARALMKSEGLGAAEAMKRLRPPVFFKRENAMQGQLRRWGEEKILRALDGLMEAEARCKTTGMPADLISQRALQTLSRMGR